MTLAICSSGSSSGVSASGSSALTKRQPNGGAHLAFLRAVGFINQEGNAQILQFGVLLDLFQHPGELLLRSDDDRLARLEEARKIISLARQPTTSFRCVKFSMSSLMFVSSDFRSVRMNTEVYQLLARARLEEAVEPVCQPTDGERLAAAGGMVDEILAANVTVGSQNVL